MAYCQHCGSSVPDGSSFCTNCGAPLKDQSSPNNSNTSSNTKHRATARQSAGNHHMIQMLHELDC